MELKRFMEGLPRGGITALARNLDISTVYLSQIAARQDGREPSPELAVRIEVATINQVRRWDLRPNDWHRIWPELIGVRDAPPAAAKE